MSISGRIVVVAVLLGLTAVSEGAKDHGGKRDFPTGTKCPVHTDIATNDDPYVFKANRSSATLTFLACDERADPVLDDEGKVSAYRGTGLDLSIDDLIVVDRDVFNANRIRYPDDPNAEPPEVVPEDYRVDRSTQACYNNDPAVTSVFRREAATAPSPTMPLYERFEGPSRRWTLVNATFGLETLDVEIVPDPQLSSQSKSLILARRWREEEREGQPPIIVPGRLCSMASVRLNRLVRGREYVIDFSWYADWKVGDDDGFEGREILTLSVDEEAPGFGGLTTRTLLRSSATRARAPAAVARR